MHPLCAYARAKAASADEPAVCPQDPFSDGATLTKVRTELLADAVDERKLDPDLRQDDAR
jgi:hypothetical protein